ncbi:hypothetical protein EMIT07CA2_50375 [Brevibacillus sp. IT-7CA2]
MELEKGEKGFDLIESDHLFEHAFLSEKWGPGWLPFCIF